MIKKIMIISMLTLGISSFNSIAAEADNMEKENNAPHSMDLAPNPNPYSSSNNLGATGVQNNPGMQNNMNNGMDYTSSPTSVDSNVPSSRSIDYRSQPMTSSMQDSNMMNGDSARNMSMDSTNHSQMKSKSHHKSMMKHGKNHMKSHDHKSKKYHQAQHVEMN